MTLTGAERENSSRLRAAAWCPLLLLLAASGVAGQREVGAVAFRQALKEAATDTSIAVFASHPDDEYVMALALLRHRYGVQAEAVLLTRGEGGQNAIGPELGRDLGVVRTFETERSLRGLGSKPFFLNLPDSGYCRSAAEAIDLWGRDDVVRRMVVAIRTLKPDVVLTLHSPEDQHGHDKALLELLPEAVRQSAASDYHTPDLRPHRVLRAFRGATQKRARLVIDFDVFDPLRGMTHRERAWRALQEHKSQFPLGSLDDELKPIQYLEPFGPALDETGGVMDLLSGLPSIWDDAELQRRAAELNDLDLRLLRDQCERLPTMEVRGTGQGTVDDQRMSQGAVQMAARVLQQFRAIAGSTSRASDLDRRIARRLAALERAIRAGSGIGSRVQVRAPGILAPGRTLALELTLQNGSDLPLEDVRVEPLLPQEVRVTSVTMDPPGRPTVPADGRIGFLLLLEASSGVAPSVPESRRLYASHQIVPLVRLRNSVRMGSTTVSWTEDVPCEIRPAVEASFLNDNVAMAASRGETKLVLRVRKNAEGPLRGKFRRLLPPGWSALDLPQEIAFEALEEELFFPIRIVAPPAERLDTFTVRIGLADGPEAVASIHRLALTLPATLFVGLVKGVDDSSIELLRSLSIPYRVLATEDLARGDFDGISTLLVDIRALHHTPGAIPAIPLMLRFAEAGGRLVVLYHKRQEFNASALGTVLAPFPLELGIYRVSRAGAPVKFLKPEHPLLTTPHRIRSEDFDGWVQERGLYFPEQYAPEYEELLAMADPGQPERRGGLLSCTTGTGTYVYCALSLFRQIRACRPGAVRLFINLLTPPPLR